MADNSAQQEVIGSPQKKESIPRYKTWMLTYPENVDQIEEVLVKFVMHKKEISLIDGFFINKEDRKVYLYLSKGRTADFFKDKIGCFDFIETIQRWEINKKTFHSIRDAVDKDGRHELRPCFAMQFGHITSLNPTKDELLKNLISKEFPSFNTNRQGDSKNHKITGAQDLIGGRRRDERRREDREDDEEEKMFDDEEEEADNRSLRNGSFLHERLEMKMNEVKSAPEDDFLSEAYVQMGENRTFEEILKSAIEAKDGKRIRFLNQHRKELLEFEELMASLRIKGEEKGGAKRRGKGRSSKKTLALEEDEVGDSKGQQRNRRKSSDNSKGQQRNRRNSLMDDSDLLVTEELKPRKKLKVEEDGEDKKKPKKIVKNTKKDKQESDEDKKVAAPEFPFYFKDPTDLKSYQDQNPEKVKRQQEFLEKLKRTQSQKIRKFISQGYNPVYILESVVDEQKTFEEVRKMLNEKNYFSEDDQGFLKIMEEVSATFITEM